MILYRNTKSVKPRVERQRQTLNINIEEKPERGKFLDRSPRERRKFVDKVEALVRGSAEYKEYIKYLKENFNMAHCEIFPAVMTGNGKKYSIEIHHEPFYLAWIVDTVIRKRQDLQESLNPFEIADEVMNLHFRGIVGLIPLSITAHELVHSDKIFIPLQFIYQQYHIFAEEYDMWIPEHVKDIINLKVDLSLKCNRIQSDILDNPVVTYVEVDGFDYPSVPDEWKNAMARQRVIYTGKDDKGKPVPEDVIDGIQDGSLEIVTTEKGDVVYETGSGEVTSESAPF